MTRYIMVRSIDNVEQLANACNDFENDIFIYQAQRRLDAKSVISWFAFNLLKPIAIETDNLDVFSHPVINKLII